MGLAAAGQQRLRGADRIAGAPGRLEPQALDHEVQAADRPHPKTAARLLRFEHAWRQLGGGYADQSHLIREFREFTGGTPADFLARSVPDAPREPANPGVVPSPAH